MIEISILNIYFQNLLSILRLKTKVKTPVAGRLGTVAKNEVRNERNGLQSVVRRAACEWS